MMPVPSRRVDSSGAVHYDCTHDELKMLMAEVRRVVIKRTFEARDAIAEDLVEEEKTGQETNECAAAVVEDMRSELAIVLEAFTGGISPETAEACLGHKTFWDNPNVNAEHAF